MKQVESFKCDTVTTRIVDNYYTLSTADAGFHSGEQITWVENTPVQCDIIKDQGKYSVFEIANWFLIKSSMTHKKLQKLCYYAQAWYYTLYDKKLENTDFQAWIHGPVSPALYERFKCFGYETIKIKSEYNPQIENNDIEFLEDIWDTYGDKTGNSLESLSHRELPWIEARRGYSDTERCTVVIDPLQMKTYYKSIYTGKK